MTKIPAPPEFGAPLPPSHPNADTLTMLHLRRSTPADFLDGPGPDEETLASILTIAARAPDHRRVTPFRFITFIGEGRSRFGTVLRKAFQKENPDAEPSRLECEENRFNRAPVVVAVISCVDKSHRTPEWEQILTAGAVCQNMLLAASAHGFAAQWLTEWYAYNEDVMTALGLQEHERIAGFLYLGTAKEDPKERARPVVADIISSF